MHPGAYRTMIAGVRPVLVTARLALRQFTTADANDLLTLDGDPRVMRFLEPETKSLAQIRAGRGPAPVPGLLPALSRFRILGRPQPRRRRVHRMVRPAAGDTHRRRHGALARCPTRSRNGGLAGLPAERQRLGPRVCDRGSPGTDPACLHRTGRQPGRRHHHGRQHGVAAGAGKGRAASCPHRPPGLARPAARKRTRRVQVQANDVADRAWLQHSAIACIQPTEDRYSCGAPATPPAGVSATVGRDGPDVPLRQSAFAVNTAQTVTTSPGNTARCGHAGAGNGL